MAEQHIQALLVKLSSMGDLVQALPAITDASKHIEGIKFHWVVDESFAEIPQWHPAVTHVHKTAHRRWRKNIRQSWRSGELKNFYHNLRAINYDAVIDAQSNIKSAVVTALAKGNKFGPDKNSVREYGAQWAYQQHFSIEKNQLAISRTRQLFAHALNYPVPTSPIDFGLTNNWQRPNIDLPTEPYLVFVHNASWTTKQWDDGRWHDLLIRAKVEGYKVVLPWGSHTEREQADAIAEPHDHAQVLPRLSLTDIAGVLAHSAGAVCMDTGLAHIAAAINTPCVTLYGPTDPKLIGATGNYSAHIFEQSHDCMPCYKKQCAIEGYVGEQAQCLKQVPADIVWNELVNQQKD